MSPELVSILWMILDTNPIYVTIIHCQILFVIWKLLDSSISMCALIYDLLRWGCTCWPFMRILQYFDALSLLNLIPFMTLLCDLCVGLAQGNTGSDNILWTNPFTALDYSTHQAYAARWCPAFAGEEVLWIFFHHDWPQWGCLPCLSCPCPCSQVWICTLRQYMNICVWY